MKNWDPNEWQGRSQHQVENSLKGFTFALIGLIIILLISTLFI